MGWRRDVRAEQRKRVERLASLCLACAAAATLLAGASQVPEGPDRWGYQEWLKWRDEGIAHIFEPTRDVAGEKVLSRRVVARRCAEVYAAVQPLLRRDPACVAREAWAGDLSNFISFLESQRLITNEAKDGSRTNALGYKVPDIAYWRSSAEYAEIPEFLRSQAFLVKTMDPSGYQAAVHMIEKHNRTLPPERRMLVMPYKAQFILSVDRTTYGRLMVLAPSERAPDGSLVDKWMLFAMATPDQDPPPLPYSVSMVAVRHGDGRAHAYFLDYMRIPNLRSGAIELVPSVTLPNSPSENCYDCHKTAVIPIKPEVEYEFDKAGTLVPKKAGDGVIPALVNSRIRSYGEVDRGPQDTAAYGPCIGPEKDRSDAFILQAAGDLRLDATSLPRIREAMKCASCHESFAPINYPEALRTDRDAISVKTGIGVAQTFVEQGWMPPDNTLSIDERKALWRCLTKEYFDHGQGAFVDWLKGK